MPHDGNVYRVVRQNINPLQNKQAILLLFIANSVSGLAQGITMLAIPWYFITVAGQQSLYGLLYALITAASIFWMLYSGALIDRFDRKHIFQGINLAGAVVLLSLALYGFITGPMNIFVASIAFATTFLIYNIHFPNLYAFAQEITHKDNYHRILSYLEIQHQLTASIAGGLAAVLLSGLEVSQPTLLGYTLPFHLHISPWPLHYIFLVDGSTYVLALLLVSLIRYKSVAEKVVDKQHIWARLRQGVDYLREHRTMLLFGTLSYAVFVSVLVNLYFLLPRYTDAVLGADVGAFALFRGIFSLGAVLSGVFVSRVFRYTKPSVAVIVLGAMGALFYWVSLVNSSLFVFYLMGLLLGLSNAGTRIMRTVYVFDRVPNGVMGRVTSIFNLYHLVFRTLFSLLFALPFFSEGRQILWAMGVLGLFVTGSMLVLLYYLPAIRKS